MNHIHDSRSKESMKEVLSCFYSDNLRSAVVMLYATVVSDLYYKITDLVAIYNDTGAEEIKKYVDDEWQFHPKLPTWETEMPKRCREKNKKFSRMIAMLIFVICKMSAIFVLIQ